MPFYDFKKDLPIALKTQEEVGKMLEKLYGARIIKFGTTNEYDILASIKEKNVTFEVKEDFYVNIQEM
jgi:hypothetical protein